MGKVLDRRVLWDKMVDKELIAFEYHRDYDRFLKNMERLGFTENQVQGIAYGDNAEPVS